MRSAMIGLFGAGLLFAAGCDDTGTMGMPDMTVQLDMAKTLDMTPLPDLVALPDMTAPIVLSGTAVLTDISAVVPIPMGDAGVQLVPVRALAPLVGFGPGGKHDFTNMGALGGCTGDHYDVNANDLPTPDVDAGTITFTGYAGGNFLNGQPAPNTISCARDMTTGFYKCGYGPLVNGQANPMAIADQTPYPGQVNPLASCSMITMTGTGGAGFGAWNGMAQARDVPVITEDLSTVKYDPTADFTFHFSCPNPSPCQGEQMNACGFTVGGVSISASQQPPAMYGGPTPTFGSITCFGVIGTGTLKINKEAIAAAFGCNAQGANCDSMLKSTRTIAVHIGLPGTAMTMDAAMSKVTLAAGRGASGVAAK
jgi:hypothetical protein